MQVSYSIPVPSMSSKIDMVSEVLDVWVLPIPKQEKVLSGKPNMEFSLLTHFLVVDHENKFRWVNCSECTPINPTKPILKGWLSHEKEGKGD